ncbi:MAG: copper-binding protein [Cyclonatronaceae bacterium]
MKFQHSFFIVLFLALFAGLLTGCGGESESENTADEERYEVDGYFLEVGMAGETITILHEDIEDVMPSMRMRMLLPSPDIAEGFSRGDAARFEIVRRANSWYLEGMEPLPEEDAPQLSEDLMQMR